MCVGRSVGRGVVVRMQWQSLVHLDAIKARKKQVGRGERFGEGRWGVREPINRPLQLRSQSTSLILRSSPSSPLQKHTSTFRPWPSPSCPRLPPAPILLSPMPEHQQVCLPSCPHPCPPAPFFLRPLQPPKKPESAPFFLPTVAGLSGEPIFDTTSEWSESLLSLKRSKMEAAA